MINYPSVYEVAFQISTTSLEEAFWAPETVPEELRRTLVKELRSQGPPEGYSFDGNR